MKYLSLLCALMLVSLSTHAQEKSTDLRADEMVDIYLENIGGVDKWTGLRNMRMDVTMTQMGMELPGSVLKAPPNKQRIEIRIQGKQMIQAYDGKTAWWINPFMGATDAQPMPDEMAKSFTEEKFESPFINYQKKGHTIDYIRDEEVDGSLCYVLKMTKSDGSETYHYFHAEYMIPIMEMTFISSGEMKGQAVETYYSDYEEVEGLMMPMSIETKVNGKTQMAITISKVTVNSKAADELFAYPKAEE